MNLNDEFGNSLVQRIMLVPKEIRFEALKGFIKKCRDLHKIAFFQWRKMFATDSEYY